MKINSDAIKLSRVDVKEPATIGTNGTKSVTSADAELTYYPGVQLVLVQKKDKPPHLIPSANVKVMIALDEPPVKK